MGKEGCVRSLGLAASVLVLLERQAARGESVSSPILISDTFWSFLPPTPKALTHTKTCPANTQTVELGPGHFCPWKSILSSSQLYDHSWPWDISVTAAWTGSA